MSTHRLFPLSSEYATRTWVAGAAFCFAGLVVSGVAQYFDDRLFNGVSIWWKPAKFWFSIGVHFVTLALLAQLLVPARRAGFVMASTAFLSVAMGLWENVYISIQAARGRASHFNYETNFEALMYLLMGVGAVILVLAPLVLSIMLATQRDDDRSGLKFGAIIGGFATFVFTLAFGGFMSQQGSHYFNVADASDAGGLPIVGWSTQLPDLRPAHFVASHILQAAPFVGWVMDKIAPSASRTAVFIVTLSMSALSAGLFILALRGVAPLGFLN